MFQIRTKFNNIDEMRDYVDEYCNSVPTDGYNLACIGCPFEGHADSWCYHSNTQRLSLKDLECVIATINDYLGSKITKMRTRGEIQEKLESLYAMRDTEDYKCDFESHCEVDLKIEMLEWVLNVNNEKENMK